MAFFTWRGFAALLKKLLPIFVQTAAAKPASMVPGALAAGIAPHVTVIASTGTKISKGKVAGYVISLLFALRFIGDATGKWHIPIGAEDQVTDIVSKGGELWGSILGFLGGLGLHALRSALPPTVVKE